MSNSTAMLIEQLYGYSKNWIIAGQEPKITLEKERGLSVLQKRIIADVKQMDEDELEALFAFIETLKKIKIQIAVKEKTPLRDAPKKSKRGGR
jgi:hypothetical protein